MKDNLKLINAWEDIGIASKPSGQTKKKCPECSHTRPDKSDTSLSVSFSKGVANCHYCKVAYKIKTEDKTFTEQPKDYKLPSFTALPLSEKTVSFFKSRGIEKTTLQYFKVTEARIWMRGKQTEVNGKKCILNDGETDCIAFDYYYEGKHTNTKFRGTLKRFQLVPKAMLTFYGIDAVKDSDWCAIQEGEIDTMTAYQCGIYRSISVPNGASAGSLKLEYLDNCIDHFENKTKIIIATDGDTAGRTLAAELIRRLGAEKCWTIEYPEGCKDTNEVLLKYGREAVKKMYDEAKPVPIIGIASEDKIRKLVRDLYDNGYPQTCKIGYPEFDQLLSFKPGELTVFTGIPSMGKTTFLDQVIIRLASRFGWKSVVFSPENNMAVQGHKLIQKFMGRSTVGQNRLELDQLDIATDFLVEHFYFMEHDEMETDINSILAKAKEMVKRKGINALVIDPWNCIEHLYKPGENETQYISKVLTQLTSFAKINYIHIFLVAHPTKMDKARDEKGKPTHKYEVPTLYKISGSANWYNKTDNGIAVHIDYDSGTVEVHVQKVKFDYVGKKGLATFLYDKPTGRYAEYGSTVKWEVEYEFYLNRLKISSQGEQSTLDLPEHQGPISDREPGVLTPIHNLIPDGYEPPF